MVNSTTKLFPAWKKLLKLLKMAIRVMPRDVATRWNSTYVMLQFALEYRVALDKFTADRENNIREYELDEEEWGIASDLRDVLKVNIEIFQRLLQHADDLIGSP